MTSYIAAAQFRGQTFLSRSGNHDDAITQMATRFPNYRETSRKVEPIVRGWMVDGKFMNLLEIARRPL